MIQRSLLPEAIKVLKTWGKMALVSGPRQVGKTTLAEQVRTQFPQGLYFNWDILTDQRRLARDPYFFDKEPRKTGEPFLLILDEIHKYARWKSYLKGVFDGFHKEYSVLVTGSGRLDLYSRGGDSLVGRTINLPLFPLSVGELTGRRPLWKDFKANPLEAGGEKPESRKIFEQLLRFSGFPDPYLRGEEEYYRIWSSEWNRRVIREDIRDTTGLRNISLLEMLVQLLPPRIGSPLSVNALREDLNVAFETVRDWLDVLSRFYYLFRISTYTRKLSRSLKKEAKIYFYDWCLVENPADRFENLVALHLLKAVRTWAALGEAKTALYYLRDKEKREVDFVVVENERPVLLVECKMAERDLSPQLLHYQERLNVPCAIQLIQEGGYRKDFRLNRKEQCVVSADRWLALLP